eukprot:5679370-Prymnesium_polylepis.2
MRARKACPLSIASTACAGMRGSLLVAPERLVSSGTTVPKTGIEARISRIGSMTHAANARGYGQSMNPPRERAKKKSQHDRTMHLRHKCSGNTNAFAQSG